MAYNAKAIKVMIASPSDVSKERQIIRQVINEWNIVNAENRKIVLMPIASDTHATPEMGDRPQAIINSQLLKDVDLLVAVFWTRLGTPTGVAPSGTVEEIQKHLEAGKPALIYFSSEPVRPDSVDNEQYSALRAFKESLRLTGLFEEYEDLSEFETKFSRHLGQTVIKRFVTDAAALLDLPEAPPRPPAPRLTPAAHELLHEAVQDTNGMIMRLQSLQGTHVQTNRKEFVQARSPQESAKWRSAVDELRRLGLVEDRTGKGEVFFVTGAGYEADNLLLRADRPVGDQSSSATT